MFFEKGRVILTIGLAIFFSCSALGQDFFEEFENLIDDEKTRNMFVSNGKSGLENYSLNKVAEQWIK